MKYMLTYLRDQDAMYEGTEEEMKQAMEAWSAFDREAIEAGVLIANEPLEHPRGAKTLRIAGGKPTVTDGPFAETKEQVGGFALLEVDGLEEAMSWAEKVPAFEGAIEVRKVMDLSPYGYSSSTPGPIEAAA